MSVGATGEIGGNLAGPATVNVSTTATNSTRPAPVTGSAASLRLPSRPFRFGCGLTWWVAETLRSIGARDLIAAVSRSASRPQNRTSGAAEQARRLQADEDAGVPDDDALAEADKQVLSAGGIPAWAQVTGNDDPLRPRLFAWVDENLTLHARLIGDAAPSDLSLLRARASELLSGQNDWATHGQPADLQQPVALAIVHEHSVGYGSMGRSEVLPLAEVAEFAQSQIEELMREAQP